MKGRSWFTRYKTPQMCTPRISFGNLKRMDHSILCITLVLVAMVTSATAAKEGFENGHNKDSRKDPDQKEASKVGVSATLADLLTREVQQTLLDNTDDLGNVGDIVAVYRHDLDGKYVAYVEVTFPANDTYMLVSTGPATGDHRFPVQGELPSISDQVSQRANEEGLVCARYIMLTPGLMMCDDVKGNTVASNAPLEELGNMTLDEFAKGNSKEILTIWQELRRSTTDEWHSSRTMSEEELEEWWRLVASESSVEQEEEGDELDEEATDDLAQPVLLAEALNSGDDVDVALGHPYSLDFVEIRTVEVGRNESQYQGLLCEIIKICDMTNHVRVSGAAIKSDDVTGLLYISLDVEDTSKMESQGVDELDLVVLMHMKDKQVVMRRYGLVALPSREKRGTKIRNCGSWTEKHIPCSKSYFPDYNQHHTGRCAVGCGPVAWAMVFGFYDRASHYGCSRYSNRAHHLYRCSGGGTYGSSACVAPRFNISHGYTEHLNNIMRTFCIFKNGATLAHRMNDVQSFFNSRVTGVGKIYTKKCFFSFLGRYCGKTKNWAKGKVDAGWPVVIGYRLGTLSWHYPVATGYRSRRCQRKRCFIFCGRWKWITQYQWYLHMGWGPYTRQWRTMEAYAAWTAQF